MWNIHELDAWFYLVCNCLLWLMRRTHTLKYCSDWCFVIMGFRYAQQVHVSSLSLSIYWWLNTVQKWFLLLMNKRAWWSRFCPSALCAFWVLIKLVSNWLTVVCSPVFSRLCVCLRLVRFARETAIRWTEDRSCWRMRRRCWTPPRADRLLPTDSVLIGRMSRQSLSAHLNEETMCVFLL